MEEERVVVVALLCKAVTKVMLSLLTLTTEDRVRQQVSTEVKLMLQRYLEPMFGQHE